eukprot:SAG31_NODE_41019_length_278_cov_0.581006_1_plen_52_part_01
MTKSERPSNAFEAIGKQRSEQSAQDAIAEQGLISPPKRPHRRWFGYGPRAQD